MGQLEQGLITKETAVSYAAYAWANNMSLNDLMHVYNIIIDCDAINLFNEELNKLDELYEKSIREQMEEEL